MQGEGPGLWARREGRPVDADPVDARIGGISQQGAHAVYLDAAFFDQRLTAAAETQSGRSQDLLQPFTGHEVTLSGGAPEARAQGRRRSAAPPTRARAVRR